jgi:hypothetical protein
MVSRIFGSNKGTMERNEYYGTSSSIVSVVKSRRISAWKCSRHGRSEKYVHIFVGKPHGKGPFGT